jgi:hypothetical protein
MNRKERRKIARTRSDDSETLVPVFCGRICVDRVGPERLRDLLKGRNVKPVTRHRDRKIVELQVHDFGLEANVPSTGGNASTESHDKENFQNPPRCWMLRRRLRKAS